MAQASSVPAREPSMEEILASIRRIIEDSDTGHPPSHAGSPPAGAAEPIAENPAPEFTQPAAEAETPAESAQEIEAFRTELSAMEQEAELQQAPVEHQEPAPAVYQPPAFHAEPEPVRQTVEPETPPRPEASQPAPARGSILSEQAGRQVAAAFEELSDAFASTERRSFDDVAEELMRPMLQDWLDNNLPLLVERLVREEIERVARGAAR